MSAEPMPPSAVAAVNEIRLVGRVAEPARRRELPSGDEVVTVRVIVDRPARSVRGTAKVDALDCAVWSSRLRRAVAAWSAGDVVEVRGAVRRRFYRAGGGGALGSRFEVEVSAARRIKKSGPAPVRREATG